MNTVLLVSTYGDFFWTFERDNISIWKDMGYKVYIAANFSESKYNMHTEELINLGVSIIDVPFVRSPFSSKTLSNYRKIRTIIKDISPVVIDCHLAVVGVLVRSACWNNKNIKIIYSPHGFFFYKGCPLLNSIIYKMIEGLMALKTDALITINTEDFANAQKMNLRGKAYFVPGVGVDLPGIAEKSNSLRSELSISQKDILLISIGELNKNKNHTVVLKALNRLIKSGYNNVHYVICGQGRLKESILNEARQNSISENVHLLGFRDDVASINKCADIFILPSFKEGLSVSIIEAMGSGLPVIASRIRGNVDLIVPGKGGYLFEPNNYEELYEKLKCLILSQDNRIAMGKFNLERSNNYSVNTVHNAMKDIYREIMA